MQDRLIFLIGAPRSGTTLLARMLGAHSAIHAPAEPHLITPLESLGYYARVERADYDPVISEQAIHELVENLPRGEEDYLEALRAYTDRIYGSLLATTDRPLLLDKTPAYALCLDFLARLYPKARYVVLTRHPLAIWSSYVQSFFDDDHEAALAHNPILARYVPAIARFLRESPVPRIHLAYEALVADPARHLEEICRFCGVDFQPGMVDYGEQAGAGPARRQGLGDPVTVGRETRPTTGSLEKWAEALASDPAKLAQARRLIEGLLDEDLETWGHPRAALVARLDAITPAAVARPRRAWNRYALQRRLLVQLRKNIHRNAFGRLVRRVRTVCDVLLR